MAQRKRLLVQSALAFGIGVGRKARLPLRPAPLPSLPPSPVCLCVTILPNVLDTDPKDGNTEKVWG